MMYPGVGHKLVEYTETLKACASEQSSRLTPLQLSQAGGSVGQAGGQVRCPMGSQHLTSPFAPSAARSSDGILLWVWSRDALAASLTIR